MKKSDFKFILILTLIAAVVWIAMELFMMKNQFPRHFYIIWRVLIIVVTCGISVWHGFKAEEERKNARAEKYKRKNNKKHR